MRLANMRLPVDDKTYWTGRLNEFTELMKIKFVDRDVQDVEFGKQDLRGGFSITLIDGRRCVPMQKHFGSKQEMLGYVAGYISATDELQYLA